MSSAFLKKPSVPLLTTQLSSIQGWTSTFQFLSLCWITESSLYFCLKIFPSHTSSFLPLVAESIWGLEIWNLPTWRRATDTFLALYSLYPSPSRQELAPFPYPHQLCGFPKCHLWNRGYFCAVRRNFTISWQLCTKITPHYQAFVSMGEHSSLSS